MIRRFTTKIMLVGTSMATIGCDRVTKHVAATSLAGEPGRSYPADTIRLEYVENEGGFLGLGADLPRAVRTRLFILGSGLIKRIGPLSFAKLSAVLYAVMGLVAGGVEVDLQ